MCDKGCSFYGFTCLIKYCFKIRLMFLRAILSFVSLECQKIEPNKGEYSWQQGRASPGEFPHMVSLGYYKETHYKFQCGGSLLSKTYVLTNARCVNLNERPTMVRTGVVDIGGKDWNAETDVGIAEIFQHKDYRPFMSYHDLALIRLNQSLSFSNTVNAVCLDTGTDDLVSSLLAIGWGLTGKTIDKTGSAILQKGNATVVSNEICNETYPLTRFTPQGIVKEQLCASGPGGRGPTCQGDTGGPLHVKDRSGRYRIIAVTSFGQVCGRRGPSVFTRISSYLDWIVDIVYSNKYLSII